MWANQRQRCIFLHLSLERLQYLTVLLLQTWLRVAMSLLWPMTPFHRSRASWAFWACIQSASNCSWIMVDNRKDLWQLQHHVGWGHTDTVLCSYSWLAHGAEKVNGFKLPTPRHRILQNTREESWCVTWNTGFKNFLRTCEFIPLYWRGQAG